MDWFSRAALIKSVGQKHVAEEIGCSLPTIRKWCRRPGQSGAREPNDYQMECLKLIQLESNLAASSRKQAADIDAEGNLPPNTASELKSIESFDLLPEKNLGAYELSPEYFFQRAEEHFYGRSGSIDYELAAENYGKAARSGHLDAVCNLGYLNALGLGGRRNSAKALELFEQASRCGHRVGMFNSAAVRYNCFVRSEETSDEFFVSDVLYDCQHPPNSRAQPERDRVDKFVTFFDSALNHFPLNDKSIADLFPLLRKIGIVRIEDFSPRGRILVIDSGDGLFIRGDLVEAQTFSEHNNYIIEQGGKNAYGLLWDVFSQPLRSSRAHEPEILGGLSQDKSLSHLIMPPYDSNCIGKIQATIGDFYRTGFVVPQSDSEANKWLNLAARNGFAWPSDS